MAQIEYRTLGKSGLVVSTIGLGCNNFGRLGSLTEGQEGTTAVIDEALDLGITLLDTADIYGVPAGTSERLMGVALKGRRDRVVLATKFGHDVFETGLLPGVPKGSREYIRGAIDDSLRRLQTDYIDLYQQHVPDPSTPIEETLGALDELVKEGKVLYIGCTQFSAEQLGIADAAAAAIGSAAFVSAQSEYSLLNRAAEHDVLPAARELGLGFLPFFPLANGLLTGKFTRTDRPADTRIMRQRPHVAEEAPWDCIERYASWCSENGVTMVQATFGWLLAQPGLTSVIAGATRPEQLAQNVQAAATKLSAAQMQQISAIFA